MKSNNVIIAVLAIVILLLVVGVGFTLMNNQSSKNSNIDKDALKDYISSNVENASSQVEVEDSQSDDSPKHYDDWQKDYETGEYDEDGNPIYRSVVSTSGGQNEPGIYEAYWSANGPISEERIG